MIKSIIILITFSSISLAGVGSYGFSSVRNMSQGGTGVANPDRMYSVGLNPAGTIMPADSSFLQFGGLLIPNGALGFNNSMFSFSEIEEYFNAQNGTSRILTEQDENDILDLLDESSEVFGQGRANLFTLGFMLSPTLGAFTITMSDNFTANATIPKQLAELAFRGNELDRTYNFDELSYEAIHLREYTLNYARPIILNSEEGFFKNLNVGIGLKLVQSLGFADLEVSNASLYTDPNAKLVLDFRGVGRTASNQALYNDINEIDADNEVSIPFPDMAGSGFGLNLGGVAELQNGILLGLSITDIGNLTYDTNVEVNDLTLVSIVEDISEKEIDSVSSGPERNLQNVSEFDISLPTALRLGATIPVHKFVPIPGLLNASIDYYQGFNENFSNNTNPRIGIGAEWLPFNALPSIMVGAGNDRFNNIRVTFGLGYSISVFDVYLGTRDFVSTISGGQRASLGLNVRWKIW